VTGNDGRILDEVGHLLQQGRLRGNEAADAPAQSTGMRFQFAADLRFTLAAIQDDEIFEESGLVVVEGLYFDRTTGPPARRQKPVTVCVRSRADVLHKRPLRVLGPTDDEGHDTSAVQQDQPADWSREDEVAFAILEIRVPPHLLRKREIAKQARP
jgi:hypothetical protein